MIRYFNKSKIIYIILFVLILFILFLLYLNYINVELIDNLLKENKDVYIKQYKTIIDYLFPIIEYLHPFSLLLNFYFTDNYIVFTKDLVFDHFSSFIIILLENFVDNNLSISDKEDFIKLRSYKYH